MHKLTTAPICFIYDTNITDKTFFTPYSLTIILTMSTTDSEKQCKKDLRQIITDLKALTRERKWSDMSHEIKLEEFNHRMSTMVNKFESIQANIITKISDTVTHLDSKHAEFIQYLKDKDYKNDEEGKTSMVIKKRKQFIFESSDDSSSSFSGNSFKSVGSGGTADNESVQYLGHKKTNVTIESITFDTKKISPAQNKNSEMDTKKCDQYQSTPIRNPYKKNLSKGKIHNPYKKIKKISP